MHHIARILLAGLWILLFISTALQITFSFLDTVAVPILTDFKTVYKCIKRQCWTETLCLKLHLSFLCNTLYSSSDLLKY